MSEHTRNYKRPVAHYTFVELHSEGIKNIMKKKCRAKHRAFSAILGIKKNTIENTVRKYFHSKHTLLFTKFDNVHFILFFCCALNKNDVNKTAKCCRADDIIL